MLDSVIRASQKYYPEILLEECKYEIKKILKWKILLMMIKIKVHLMMKLTMNLIMKLNLTMKNLLKFKNIF